MFVTLGLIVFVFGIGVFALFIGLRAFFAQTHQMNKRIENACRGCSGLFPYER